MVSKYRNDNDGNGEYWDGTPEEQAEYDGWALRQDTLSKLATVDTKSARPLRAIAAGTATQADYDTLAALEQEASGLRAQL